MSGLAVEINALVLGLGLVFGLICYLGTNLSPGGMITPGWLTVIFIQAPQLAALVIGVVIGSYIISRILMRYIILYGKRLFATVVLTGVFLQVTFLVFVSQLDANNAEITTLGFIVPRLIAYQLIRQPIIPTLLATATVTLTTYVLVLVGVAFRFIRTEGRGVAAERVEVPTLDPNSTTIIVAGISLLVMVFFLIRSMCNVERSQAGSGEGA